MKTKERRIQTVIALGDKARSSNSLVVVPTQQGANFAGGRLLRRFSIVPVGTLLFFMVHCTVALGQQSGKKLLTLDDVIHPDKITASGISNLIWRPDGKQVTFVRRVPQGSARLCAYDLERHAETILLDSAKWKEQITLDSYQWSPKGDTILLEGDKGLWLVSVPPGIPYSRPEGAVGGPPSIGRSVPGLMVLVRQLTQEGNDEVPAFSPAGDRIAFVHKHDLYVVNVQGGAPRRLTSDGSDTVFNGRLDWVYEEELANRSTARAFEWSPDGKRLAFLRLDDSPVPEYPITDFLATHVSLLLQRFPQAGDANPRPSLRVLNVDDGMAQPSVLNLDAKQVEYLGPSFVWTSDGSAVCFLALNRAQTDVAVHRWEPGSGRDQTLLIEHDPNWVNSLEPPHFLKGGREFLWVSERDGWQHLYLYSADGKLLRQVTQGAWMLDRPIFEDAPLYQLDPDEQWVYFAATTPDPREKQLYRQHLDGKGRERLTTEAGTHTLNLSPDGRFAADTFSAPDTPPTVRLLQPGGAVAAVIDSPGTHLGDYAVGQRDFLEVKAHDGVTLYATLLKPPSFDPARKYPMIVDVYGGPHVQLVEKHWDGDLFDHLLAQNGFLIWTLDGRGSWGRGHDWETAIFENLGKRELEDQLAGVDYLKTLPYVDSARLGIRGWSYGGYMTLYALTHAPGVFKCGAAGAPVTDWKFYDSIYTERYMRTPAENPTGYRSASPLEAAANLRGRLLLIHGTADDNVHMQNSINFLDALVRAGKPYELHIQPGQKHGFQGDAPRTYVNQRILDFFKENL